MNTTTFNDNADISDLGQGPAVVLINGLSRTKRHWLGFASELAKNHRIITLDMRGLGTSPMPGSWTMTIDDMSEDIFAALDSLGVQQAHIFGISLGGMVAMNCGIKKPERCLSLTVVNSSIANWQHLRISVGGLFFLGTQFLKYFNFRDHAMRLVDLVVGKDMMRIERQLLADEFRQIERSQPTSAVTVMQQILAALRFAPHKLLFSMNVPMLVVKGSHDYFVPNKNSDYIVKWAPNANMVTVPSGGHELMYDKRSELVRIVTEWAAKNHPQVSQLA